MFLRVDNAIQLFTEAIEVLAKEPKGDIVDVDFKVTSGMPSKPSNEYFRLGQISIDLRIKALNRGKAA